MLVIAGRPGAEAVRVEVQRPHAGRPRPFDVRVHRVAHVHRLAGRHLEDFVVGDVYKHWPGKTIT